MKTQFFILISQFIGTLMANDINQEESKFPKFDWCKVAHELSDYFGENNFAVYNCKDNPALNVNDKVEFRNNATWGIPFFVIRKKFNPLKRTMQYELVLDCEEIGYPETEHFVKIFKDWKIVKVLH